MSLFNQFFKRGAAVSPDAIQFDAAGYQFQGVVEGAKIWHLAEGGGIGLYCFNRKPDLPVRAGSVAELKASYAGKLDPGQTLVACEVFPLDGVRGVWLIIKTVDASTRFAIYVGSLTIPFRDFSFVVKVQCQEQGVTGMRESLLVAEALRNGTGRIEDGRFVPEGWSFDDEQFDKKLPQHPLSRVRRELRHIAGTIRIDAKIKSMAGFDLPPSED